MERPELLAPAGNKESLIAAIEAGADAIYLGGNMFGARSFANNFDNDELKFAVDYAHEYGVKLYVTVNTLIYENEVNTFINYIGVLNEIGVDAVIMQDLGMVDLVKQTYPELEIHASTQMHIHNQEGVNFVSKLGLTRAVLARETSYETIKQIKNNTNLELEIFVHGALCISYSGQCLMSSLIGNRSGNRGTCAGSCRHKYDVLDEKFNKVNEYKYNLSTKDLNSLNDLEKLIETRADSFKIEGRMKSPEYVYLVVKLYRLAIDSYFEKGKVEIDFELLSDLTKTFNRKFTKGFLFNTKNNDIINNERPNHMGIEIGEVVTIKKSFVDIKLNSELNINDGIRIVGEEDTGFIVTSMFKNKSRIQNAKKDDTISIPIKNKDIIKGKVFKTLDFQTNKKINEELKKLKRKVNINAEMILKIGDYPMFTLSDGINKIEIKGNKIVEHAEKMPTDVNRIKEQILKTGDSIYKIKNLKLDYDKDLFISIKEINEIRRRALNELSINRKKIKTRIKAKYIREVNADFEKQKNENYYIKDKKQFNIIKNKKIDNLYLDIDIFKEIDFKNKIMVLGRIRNNNLKYNESVLVGEVGGLSLYKNFETDYSLNVTNSFTLALLHSIGAKKVTLSLELDEKQIIDIIKAYKKRYNVNPNIQVIVYGKEEVMISKFNLLKYYNIKNKGYLLDRFNNKYPIIEKNNLMHIYNFKCRNFKKYNQLFDIGINNVRFDYVDEN